LICRIIGKEQFLVVINWHMYSMIYACTICNLASPKQKLESFFQDITTLGKGGRRSNNISWC